MAQYIPPSQDLWQGRIDGMEPDTLRWHQVVETINLTTSLPAGEKKGIALLGFGCDEGVRRNKGRIGAKEGPTAIRRACGGFPVMSANMRLSDAGDVACDDNDLEAAQVLLGEKVAELLQGGYLPVVLGGGHEVAYGNFLGISPMLKEKEFGIINFDAHFDIRAVDPIVGATSGTGIWQMHEHCKKAGSPFHYLALGIQQYSNTRRLFDTMAQLDSAYFLADQFIPDEAAHILHIINCILRNADLLQLTIDMDVFAVAHAPGVSAQAFNGIAPGAMFKQMVRHIIASGKLASIDIAETNPRYDIDDRTSRLAATIVFDIIQEYCSLS